MQITSLSYATSVKPNDVTLARVCKLCGQGFEYKSNGPGRPREHCYKCVPLGYKAVRLPHRVKLRRITPLGPRMLSVAMKKSPVVARSRSPVLAS
jgi:hypothetical protein